MKTFGIFISISGLLLVAIATYFIVAYIKKLWPFEKKENYDVSQGCENSCRYVHNKKDCVKKCCGGNCRYVMDSKKCNQNCCHRYCQQFIDPSGACMKNCMTLIF